VAPAERALARGDRGAPLRGRVPPGGVRPAARGSQPRAAGAARRAARRLRVGSPAHAQVIRRPEERVTPDRSGCGPGRVHPHNGNRTRTPCTSARPAPYAKNATPPCRSAGRRETRPVSPHPVHPVRRIRGGGSSGPPLCAGSSHGVGDRRRTKTPCTSARTVPDPHTKKRHTPGRREARLIHPHQAHPTCRLRDSSSPGSSPICEGPARRKDRRRTRTPCTCTQGGPGYRRHGFTRPCSAYPPGRGTRFPCPGSRGRGPAYRRDGNRTGPHAPERRLSRRMVGADCG